MCCLIEQEGAAARAWWRRVNDYVVCPHLLGGILLFSPSTSSVGVHLPGTSRNLFLEAASSSSVLGHSVQVDECIGCVNLCYESLYR